MSTRATQQEMEIQMEIQAHHRFLCQTYLPNLLHPFLLIKYQIIVILSHNLGIKAITQITIQIQVTIVFLILVATVFMGIRIIHQLVFLEAKV